MDNEPMSQLSELLRQAAERAIADGFTEDMIDGHPGGNVHRWVIDNVHYRPESGFFVVTLLGCELADAFARMAGYESQADRAAQLTFSRYRNTQTVPGLPASWERIPEEENTQ